MIVVKIVSIVALLFSVLGHVKVPEQTVVTTTSTFTPTTTTTLIPQSIVEQWDRVAQCESHSNWSSIGPTFSGGLGISNVVWLEYGGREFAPNAGLATKEQQIIIARRINSNGYIPDQDGRCTKW